jgi:hypothetical protein
MKRADCQRFFRREPTGTSADDWHAFRLALFGAGLVFLIWRLVT